MIELLPIDAVRPSAYNPRETDPARLELVKLSLRKLGWLLPIYADADGEILSGHQRQLGAQELGWDMLPVELVTAMPLADRKAVNIVFNRGTNDLAADSTPKDLTEAIHASGVYELAETLPDVEGPDRFPCLKAVPVAVSQLTAANAGRWNGYARNIARTLRTHKIRMPVVCGPGLKIVNGLGRVEMAAEAGEKAVPVVHVGEAQAKLAEVMLNLLSMDFTLHDRYADLLRYNSFRRARRTRKELGRGFVFPIIGNAPANTFDVTKLENAVKWQRVFGTRIVDFGAGHLTETGLLRSIGVDVTPFEPYRLGPDNEIDKPESVDLARKFLAEIAQGRKWDAVVISSVLNSVPFAADRRHIVALSAALCTPGRTRVFALASSIAQCDWKDLRGKDYVNPKNARTISFALDYEPGIKLGDFSDKPKVQKYHTTAEFRGLFAERFETVRSGLDCGDKNVWAIAKDPRPVDTPESLAALAAAIAFEFNLPYPDGSTMGLVDEARAAFEARLGVSLP